jgi:WD40 repeat protein
VYYAFLFQAANIVLSCNPNLNHAKFWSLDGQEIKSLKTNSSVVRNLNFTPNGKTLIYNGGSSVNLWNLDLDYLLKQGCDWVRGYLLHNPNVNDKDKTLCN